MVQGLNLHACTAESMGLILGQGTKIPHAMQHGQRGKKVSKFQLPDKREEAREGESWRFTEHENCKFQSRSSSGSRERNTKEGCQAYVCPCTKRGL